MKQLIMWILLLAVAPVHGDVFRDLSSALEREAKEKRDRFNQVAQPMSAPILKPFADNKDWLLIKELKYIIGSTDDEILVPAGFVTDFASIPQSLWSFGLSPHGNYSKAAIVHDYLYWTQSCTRLQADNLLLIAMKESNVSSATQLAIYEGVRAGGWSAWSSNAEMKRKRLPRVVPESATDFGPFEVWPKYQAELAKAGIFDPVFPATPGYCKYGDSTLVPGK